MSKQTTLFNPGKLLEVLENGLTFLSVRLENTVEDKLGRVYKKDARNIVLKKREKQRRKQNKERAKSQDISLELESEKRANISTKENSQAKERLQELENSEQDVSHDAELDRE